MSHEGLLYVVGGDDGNANLNSVEVFNPLTNSWSMLLDGMAIGRSYAGIAIINRPLRKCHSWLYGKTVTPRPEDLAK